MLTNCDKNLILRFHEKTHKLTRCRLQSKLCTFEEEGKAKYKKKKPSECEIRKVHRKKRSYSITITARKEKISCCSNKSNKPWSPFVLSCPVISCAGVHSKSANSLKWDLMHSKPWKKIIPQTKYQRVEKNVLPQRWSLPLLQLETFNSRTTNIMGIQRY